MNRIDQLERQPSGERGNIVQTQILVRPDLGKFDDERRERWEKFDNQQIAVQAWTQGDAPHVTPDEMHRLLADDDTLKIVIGNGLAADSTQLDNSVSLVRTIFAQLASHQTLKDKKVVILGMSLNGFPGSLFRSDFVPTPADVHPDEFAGMIDDALTDMQCSPDSTVVAGHSSGGETALRLADKYATVALHPAIGANTTQDIFSILESLEGISDKFGFIADKAENIPGVGRFVKSFINSRREDLTNAVLKWLVSDKTTAISKDIAYQVAMHVRCKQLAGPAYGAKLAELSHIDVNPFGRLADAKFKPIVLRSHGGDRLTKQEATEYYLSELQKHGLNVMVTSEISPALRGVIDFDETYTYGHDAPFLIQEACDTAAAAIIVQLQNVERVRQEKKRSAVVEAPPVREEPKIESHAGLEVDPFVAKERRDFALQQFTDLIVSVKRLLQETNTKLDVHFQIVDEFTAAGLDEYLVRAVEMPESEFLKYLDGADVHYGSFFAKLAQMELTLAWKKALVAGRAGASQREIADIAFNTVGLRAAWARLHSHDTVTSQQQLRETPNTIAGLDGFALMDSIIFDAHRTHGMAISVVSMASSDKRYNDLYEAKQLVGWSIAMHDADIPNQNILDLSEEKFHSILTALEEELAYRLQTPIQLHEQDFALMADIMAQDTSSTQM